MKHNVITEHIGNGITRLVIDVNHQADSGVVRTWEGAAHIALEAVKDFATTDGTHSVYHDLAEINQTIADMGEEGVTLPHMLDVGASAYPHVTLSDDEIIAHLARKQRDYGTGNILAFGEFGLLVRMSDKAARLDNLLARDTDAVAEPLEDAWLDLVGYSVIAYMVLAGTFTLPLAEFSLPWTDEEFRAFLHDTGSALITAVHDG